MSRLLHQLLEDSSARFPDRPAVIQGDRVVSYAEMDRRSNQVARLLVAEGVQVGDRVGLFIDKSVEAVIGIYGILKAGASYVPLDFRAPSARLGYIAGNCGLSWLITTGKKTKQWPELMAAGAPLKNVIIMDGADPIPPAGVRGFGTNDLERQSNEPVSVDLNEDDLGYILYTSGSTGQPKGVMLSHRNGLAFVEWAIDELSLTSEDRLSSHAPFHFDLSIFDLYAAAGVGAAVALVPSSTSVFPMEVARFIREKQISVWYSVPSILSLLIQHANLAEGDLPGLRAMVFAGEVFPAKFLSRLMTTLPHVSFHNWYGPTETNVCTAYPVPSAPDPLGPDIPIGRAITGVETIVMTADGRLADPGDEGELLVKGPTVMKGYWGDPEKTAARLVPDPMAPGSGEVVYRTGDLVAEGPGGYRFLGRRDHQIKSRGYRIELGEIETAINAHPDVIECAVTAVPDDVISNRIIAYVAAQPQLDDDTLAAWCATLIPKYMVPESFVFADLLPKTSTGKIDRQALQKTG
ncbi:MAG TPA: amino acid adenylation domain-containing protein [Acidimicrobiia bacterium]|nr:amino acid adenylation domain-containing protein [Acidimicrobiia bacterium]